MHMVDELNPRLKYYTKLQMSEHTLADLNWWKKFLKGKGNIKKLKGGMTKTSNILPITMSYQRCIPPSRHNQVQMDGSVLLWSSMMPKQ
jgi:hypothetical protein